jgi:RNA polymerase sigma-70 factor (ECF subfamily)
MNELIDVQRSSSRRSRREERHGHDAVASSTVDHPESSVEVVVEGIPVDDLRAAVTTLSTAHQEVITLRWFAEFEPAEIAAALGISTGAVAVRTHRAMTALRAALGVDTKEGAKR